MRPILVFVAALALLLTSLFVAARWLERPATSVGAASRSGDRTLRSIPTVGKSLTTIESAGGLRIGEVTDVRVGLCREAIVNGSKSVVEFARIASERAVLRSEKNYDLQNPVITFFDKDGLTPTSRITARRGTATLLEESRGEVDLMGSVECCSYPEGRVILQTEELHVSLESTEHRVRSRSLSSDSRVRVLREGKNFEISGTGFRADLGNGPTMNFESGRYELQKDVLVKTSGAAARALSGDSVANDEVTIRSQGRLVAERLAVKAEDATRIRLTFDGPVSIESGTTIQKARQFVVVLERPPGSAESREDFAPVALDASGDVSVESDAFAATAQRLVTTFRRDPKTQESTLDEMTFSGSPDVRLLRAKAGAPSRAPADEASAGTIHLTCAGELRLRSTAKADLVVDASDRVRVELPSGGEPPTVLTAGALSATLEGKTERKLTSLVASRGAKFELPDATVEGQTIELTEKTIDVNGSPRLELANGSAFRSNLLFEDVAHRPGDADPVVISCRGPMKVETDEGSRKATFSDGVSVLMKQDGKSDSSTLDAAALTLRTREVDGRPELSELLAEGGVQIRSPRIVASGDRMSIEPEKDGQRRSLLLEGGKDPASVTILKSGDSRGGVIRARSLRASEVANAPQKRRLLARGDVVASFVSGEKRESELAPAKSEWSIVAPEADILVEQLASEKKEFDIREMEARGGVVLVMESPLGEQNEARGSQFAWKRDGARASGVLVGEDGKPAFLATINPYEVGRRDTALAPEFQLFVALPKDAKPRLEKVYCPAGGTFTLSAPDEDLPAVVPPRKDGASKAAVKSKGSLLETVLTSKGPATLVPYDRLELTGGTTARTRGSDGVDAGFLEGESCTITFLGGDAGPLAGHVDHATLRGSAHLRHGQLEGFAESIELQSNAEWVVFYGGATDARVTSRQVTKTASFIRYHRATGEFEAGRSRTNIRPPEKKKS